MDSLWTAWPISGPWHLSPLVGGKNNLIWRAETADRQLYVLRVVPDANQIPRLHYEAALLQALHAQGLPFQLPIPLKARNGDSVVPFEQEDGSIALATLCHLLPGRLTDYDEITLSGATNAAEALATLDLALANLPELPTIDGFQPLPAFGELASWHPNVPDPLAAVRQLPIPDDQVRQIHSYLSEVLESVPELYSHLPQQLLHRDYDYGNILVGEQEQITAVLDFEFASRDIRILELCVPLSWWPHNLWDTGQEWDVLDAFGAAYVKNFPLSEDELRAIPAVWQMRDATSFVYRMGRYFAGQVTDAQMQARVQHSLWRKEWLTANHATFLQHALRWL